MRRVPLFLLCCVCFVFTGCSDNATSPLDDQSDGEPITREELVESDNAFGFRLFRQLVDENPDSNVFISPLSVSLALGMTANGARGATLEAMLSTLGLEGYSLESANETYKALVEFLTALDPEVQFEVANSIWCPNQYSFRQEFFDDCKTYYDALVRDIDFTDPASSDTINEWVCEKTHGRICEMVPKPIDAMVMMILLNAIYFKGTWRYEFDPAYTSDEWFYLPDGSRTRCSMMKRPGPDPEPYTYILSDYKYYSDDTLQIVDLPYGDSLFTMTVLLPRPEVHIDTLIGLLDASRWQWWAGKLLDCRGRVGMPRFELEFGANLNQALKALGMGIAFGAGADFSRMCNSLGLFISDVRHKTYVRVDEAGTEAAAVTEVDMSTGYTPDCSHFSFWASRPFVFVIRENQANTILFIGKITNPN
jgi:serine protease inhibitor